MSEPYLSSEELFELHERKLAEAQASLAILREREETYRHGLQTIGRRRAKQALTRRRFEEASSLGARHEKRLVARERATDELLRSGLWASPAWAEDLSELLRPLVEPRIEVDRVFRQEVFAPRGKGEAMAFRAREVPPEGLRAGLRAAALRILPRDNEHLFSYGVFYKRSYSERTGGDLTRELARFLSKRLRTVAEARTHLAPFKPLVCVREDLVQPGDLEAMLPAVLERTRREEGSVRSNDAGLSYVFFERHAELHFEALMSLSKEFIEDFNESVLPPSPLRMERVSIPEPEAPVIPEPAPVLPQAPRIIPGTTRFWEELSWEAHRLLLGLDSQRGGPESELLLGYDPNAPFDSVLIPRSLLAAHAHIVGGTQTHKTTAALMPIMVQLIRGSDENPGPAELKGPPPPLLIIDMKGDESLFRTAEIEARKRGQRFHYFSTVSGKDSHVFDLFGSLESLDGDVNALAGILSQGLDLYHGSGYGFGYFSKENREAIAEGIDECLRQSGDGSIDLEQFVEAVRTRAKGRSGFDAREAFSTLRPLTRPGLLSRLRPAEGADPERVIRMRDVVRDRAVVYASIPTLRTTAGNDLGRLLLYSFMAAVEEENLQGNSIRSYAIIDEFQEVASYNIGRLLAFSSGIGLSIILANQSMSQLRSGGLDIREDVEANVNLRIALTVGNKDDIEALQALSGEKRVRLNKHDSRVGGGQSRTHSETDSSSKTNTHGDSIQKMNGTSSSQSSGSSSGPNGLSSHNSSSFGQNQSLTHGENSSRGEMEGKALSKGGGEQENWSEGEGEAEAIRPALDADTILDASNRERASIVISKRSDPRGFFKGRPRVVQLLFATELDEYLARKTSRWPDAPLLDEFDLPAGDKKTIEKSVGESTDSHLMGERRGDAAASSVSNPRQSGGARSGKQPRRGKAHPRRREFGSKLQSIFDSNAPPHVQRSQPAVDDRPKEEE